MEAKVINMRKEEEEEEEEIELELGLSLGGSYNGRQNGNVVQEEVVTDVKRKREIHALRRQEAMKKRELKKSLKKFKRDEDGEKLNLRLSVEPQNGNLNVLPQYVNGFVYPYGNVNVVPCWLAAAAGGGGGGGNGEERNVNVVPVVGYGFEPFGSDPVQNFVDGYDSEHNGDRNGKAGSICSSYSASDRRSSSHEGGGSSDTRSHSNLSIPEQPQLDNLRKMESKSPPEQSATSHLPEACPVNTDMNCSEKMNLSNCAQSSPTEQKLETNSEKECDPIEKRSSTPENTVSTPSMECKGDMGKPPKPQTQSHITPSLPHMPCVSTTGDGPNGKTINGFLYKYTKTEVSILCVCHGSSFSPAEFVQHAGGTDVSQPLKHITVLPSVF